MNETPTVGQKVVIDTVCTLVNLLLNQWPRQSGKTWLRKELARRIIEDDEAWQSPPNTNPYL